MPAGLKDIQESCDVAIHICFRIGKAVANTCLGSQIDDHIESAIGKKFMKRIPIFKLKLDKLIIIIFCTGYKLIIGDLIPGNACLFKSAIFQIDIIVIIDDVQTRNMKSLINQFIGQVESIEKDFSFVLDQVGLDSVPLQVYNKSQRKDRQLPEITDGDYAYLGKLFEGDFQILNYDPALRITRTKSG